jgi:hypothetical protein
MENTSRSVKLTITTSRTVEIDLSRIEQLQTDLQEAAKFQQFLNDPKTFVQAYGLSMDDAMSEALKRALAGRASLSEVQAAGFVEPEIGHVPAATLWAVATPVLGIADTKIAVVV